MTYTLPAGTDHIRIPIRDADGEFYPQSFADWPHRKAMLAAERLARATKAEPTSEPVTEPEARSTGSRAMMRTVRTLATIAAATLALIATSGTAQAGTYAPDMPGCVSAANGSPGEDITVQYCDQYELYSDDTIDPVAECLVAEGYHGKAGDHRAVIYATADAIDGCVYWSENVAGEFTPAIPVTTTAV